MPLPPGRRRSQGDLRICGDLRTLADMSTPSEKTTREESRRPSRGQQTLAIVDCDIISGKDEVAREQLVHNLRQHTGNGVKPLWVNWLRQRADLRFTCLVHDVLDFNNFMLDTVRNVEGVRETSTILSFGGRADIDSLLDLEMEVSTNNMVAANIMIDVQPGMDRRCFQGLLDLPAHPQVRRVWLLNCYHSDSADLMMLLVGKNLSAITGYVMSWIRTTPGVVDTEVLTVMDWRWLASSDDIVELCEMFFTRMEG